MCDKDNKFRPYVIIVIKRMSYDLGSNAVGPPLEEASGNACRRAGGAASDT